MDDVHHLCNVFIGLWYLFGQGVPARGPDDDTHVLHLPEDIFPFGPLRCLGAAHYHASPMTTAGKGLLACRLRTHQDIGTPAHISGDKYRLAYLPIGRRGLGMPRG